MYWDRRSLGLPVRLLSSRMSSVSNYGSSQVGFLLIFVVIGSVVTVQRLQASYQCELWATEVAVFSQFSLECNLVFF